MFDSTVLAWIEKQQGLNHQISCTFKIYGLTESKLDDLVKTVELGDGARLSFRVHFPDLTLRLTVHSNKEQKDRFTEACAEIRKALGGYVYAERDVTMEQRVGELLLQKRQTLALAESCTGGLISQRITRIAGSSAYYYGGAVTYANEAKINFLGVKPETLEEYGAVSKQTALEMSRGIRMRTGASIGFSITGIAGPSGGSPENRSARCG